MRYEIGAAVGNRFFADDNTTPLRLPLSAKRTVTEADDKPRGQHRGVVR